MGRLLGLCGRAGETAGADGPVGRLSPGPPAASRPDRAAGARNSSRVL